MEGNLLDVEKLSEVLQKSCTPEGQTALSQEAQTLFGKTPALRKILEDERTQEGNSDPDQSSIQCIEPQQPGVSTKELQSFQVSVVCLTQEVFVFEWFWYIYRVQLSNISCLILFQTCMTFFLSSVEHKSEKCNVCKWGPKQH